MDLRKNIGKRISEARKAMGLTITDLVKKSDNLSIGKVSNWERGTRSPKPGEIILLAELLDVSPNYLLCTTTDPKEAQSNSISNGAHRVKVFSMEEIVKAGVDLDNVIPTQWVTIDGYGSTPDDFNLLASIVDDSSMEPEFNKGDLIVVDSKISPKPGDYVLVYLAEKKQVLLRKYGEAQDGLFRLLVNNKLWVSLDITEQDSATLLGRIIEHRRFFK